MAINQLISHFAIRCLVGQLKCLRTKPLHADDRNRGARYNTSQGRLVGVVQVESFLNIVVHVGFEYFIEGPKQEIFLQEVGV